LFLLLRFLTAPMPAVSTAAVPAAAVMTDADALRDARGYMATIEGGPTRIRTFMRGAQNGPLRMSCVAQRLQEAQVHVVLARDEMKVLADRSSETDGGRGRDENRAHALKRLSLMAQRTAEVERAARLCVDDELSTVNATKFETDVPAAVERLGDPTTPPAPVRPCPAGNGCIILP
jgi:hypothetical protein